jgi:hypothetical protein
MGVYALDRLLNETPRIPPSKCRDMVFASAIDRKRIPEKTKATVLSTIYTSNDIDHTWTPKDEWDAGIA